MRSARTSSLQSYRTVCFVAVVAQVVIVVTGAAVRLTGSGLGCTDWPGCSNDRFVPAWGFHHWVEFGNRLFIIVLLASGVAATVGALRLRPRRRDLVWLAAALIGGVFAQAIVGAVVVVLDLDPRWTVVHFLLSIVLIADAAVLYHRVWSETSAGTPRRSGAEHGPVAEPNGAVGEPTAPPLTALRPLSAALAVSAALVVTTGTLVTGSGPHGGDDRAARFAFRLTSIARVHSAAMWLFCAVVVTSLVLARRGGLGPGPRRPLVALAAVTAGQGALGYIQYALGVPAGLVALHVLGASLVWALAVTTLLRTRQAVGARPTRTAARAASLPVLSER